MWKVNKTGEMVSCLCDICGQPGPIRVQVGNIIIAELCGEHAESTMRNVRATLKTSPGAPGAFPNKEGR